MIELSDKQKQFATFIGYEVELVEGGYGINLGLYFPEVLAKDGIITPNGVNVFFPKENKIYIQNFNQVELIFPKDEPIQMNSSEVLFGFMGWLTSREEVITLSSRHLATPAVEAISKFMEVNKLPPVRDGWEKILVHPEKSPKEAYESGPGISTKHTSQCLRKAKDDEPIFVLRSKDATAPKIVRAWASVNQEFQPEEKVKGARDLAEEMEAWHRENCI